MEYISKHKIDNIPATLPISFLFLLQLINNNQRQSSLCVTVLIIIKILMYIETLNTFI